jgi:hypothetical protein
MGHLFVMNAHLMLHLATNGLIAQLRKTPDAICATVQPTYATQMKSLYMSDFVQALFLLDNTQCARVPMYLCHLLECVLIIMYPPRMVALNLIDPIPAKMEL